MGPTCPDVRRGCTQSGGDGVRMRHGLDSSGHKAKNTSSHQSLKSQEQTLPRAYRQSRGCDHLIVPSCSPGGQCLTHNWERRNFWGIKTVYKSRHALVRVSSAVIKHHDPKRPGEERSYFVFLRFSGHRTSRGKSGQDLKAET